MGRRGKKKLTKLHEEEEVDERENRPGNNLIPHEGTKNMYWTTRASSDSRKGGGGWGVGGGKVELGRMREIMFSKAKKKIKKMKSR